MIRKFIQIPHPVTAVHWDGSNTTEIRSFIGNISWFLPGIKNKLEAAYWDNKQNTWIDLPEGYWLLKRSNGDIFGISYNDLMKDYAEIHNEG